MEFKTRRLRPGRQGARARALPALALGAAIALSGAGLAQTFDPQGRPEAPAQAASGTSATAAPGAATPATAVAAPQKRKTRNPTGSPLDTLMNTKLFADVPEAKDFVRATRPPAQSLEFKPTTGTDPARPKPRTGPELDALRSELEGAARKNAARAGLRQPPGAAAEARAAAGKDGGPKRALPN